MGDEEEVKEPGAEEGTGTQSEEVKEEVAKEKTEPAPAE